MIEADIIINGAKVHYRTFGSPEGVPLLVLHGWSSQSSRWEKVSHLLVEGAQKRGKGLCMVVPDLPGFGQSQEPPVAWGVDQYVEWVRAFSSAIPQLQKDYYLLGHSFGGAVAAKLAISYNQHIKSLLLVAAACVRDASFTKKMFGRIASLVTLFSFLPGYAVMRKVIYRLVIKKSDYPDVSGVMKETYLKVIHDNVSAKLAFIRIPTVLIWGDKDTLTPISQGRVINKKIEGSSLVVIPGGQHALQLQMPEALSEAILQHL